MANGTIVIRLPDEKKEALKILAKRKGMDLSNLTRSILYGELEREAGRG